jgi:methyl-accepting chemotaxis protein
MVIGVVDELSKSARFIKISIERAKKSSKDARVSLELIKKHRRNLRDIAKRLERLDAIASDIAKNSKKVDDLKNRADMIGLSVSITATELGDKGRGLLSLANEIERLAERTHEASSEIEENHKKVRAEIKKIETALRTSTLETSDLSVFPIEAGNALAEFEKNLTGFLSLQNDMLASNREHKERISDAFNGLANAVSGYEADYAPLKESDGLFSQVLQSMELLYETATQNNNEASKTTVNLTDTNLDNGRSATGWEIGANQ